MQVLCRYPGQCQGSGVCRNWPTESLIQLLPGCVIRRTSACTRIPPREDNSTGGSLRSETDEGIAKDKVFARIGNRTRTQGPRPSTLSTKLSLHPIPGTQVQGPLHYPLSYRFTPYRGPRVRGPVRDPLSYRFTPYRGPRVQGPLHYPLSYRFTPYRGPRVQGPVRYPLSYHFFGSTQIDNGNANWPDLTGSFDTIINLAECNGTGRLYGDSL